MSPATSVTRREVVRDEDLAEPASVLPDIETDDREPLADELAHGPRADATERTRDEEPFPAHATDRTLANRQTFVQSSDPLDLDRHPVSVAEVARGIAEGADATRRAGRDHVAGLEREGHRAVADDLRHAEKHRPTSAHPGRARRRPSS